jgi:hypothetical protein
MVMLVAQTDFASLAPFLTIVAVFFGVVGVLTVWVYRRVGRGSNRGRADAFEGVEIFDEPGPGRVGVRFHTYHGMFVHSEQVEHAFFASPEDARRILSRLHRINLTWGLTARGIVIAPILSIMNYAIQRKRIAKQEARMTGGAKEDIWAMR